MDFRILFWRKRRRRPPDTTKNLAKEKFKNDDISLWGAGTEQAPQISGHIVSLAAQYPLVCFDPQAGKVYLPPRIDMKACLETVVVFGLHKFANGLGVRAVDS